MKNTELSVGDKLLMRGGKFGPPIQRVEVIKLTPKSVKTQGGTPNVDRVHSFWRGQRLYVVDEAIFSEIDGYETQIEELRDLQSKAIKRLERIEVGGE